MGLIAFLELFNQNKIRKGSAMIEFDGDLLMRSLKNSNRFHPIDISKTDLQKGIMKTRESLSKDHGISIR